MTGIQFKGRWSVGQYWFHLFDSIVTASTPVVHQSSFTKPCKPWQDEYEFYSGDFFVLSWTWIFLSGHQVLITKRQNGLFVSPFQNDPYEWLLKMGSQRVSVVRNSVSIHLNLLPVTLYYHNVLKLCFSERTVTVTTRDCLLENT